MLGRVASSYPRRFYLFSVPTGCPFAAGCRYRGGLRKVGGARNEEKFCSDYTYDKVFCHNFNKCYNEI